MEFIVLMRGRVTLFTRHMDHHTEEVSEGTAQQWSSEPHSVTKVWVLV